MSKIVIAVNSMISNSDKISNVIQNGNEYFFLYDNKYKWSIRYNHDNDEYQLFYYADQTLLEEIASRSLQDDWGDTSMVTYSTKTLGTTEAYKTFEELYHIVSEKLFGIDKVLDDIIGVKE